MEFDCTFWYSEMPPRINDFFHTYEVPEMTERVRNGLPLLDTGDNIDEDKLPDDGTVTFPALISCILYSSRLLIMIVLPDDRQQLFIVT